MIAGLLLLCAAVLISAPFALVRITRLRRSPRAALFVWQALAVSAVLCLLTATPIALLRPRPFTGPMDSFILATATVASVGVLLRLLANGHSIGRRIRALRAEHRDLVDLVGRHEGHTRVLPSAKLSAYCVPGSGARLVITEAALTSLPDEQLAAVVAHEQAHLRERHDLILEFFTVLHASVPTVLRADGALREVALLVEILADRAAREQVGEVALGRAITSLAEAATHTDLTPGAFAGAGAAAVRIRLLTQADPAPWQTLVLYLVCIAALVTPPALALALTR